MSNLFLDFLPYEISLKKTPLFLIGEGDGLTPRLCRKGLLDLQSKHPHCHNYEKTK